MCVWGYQFQVTPAFPRGYPFLLLTMRVQALLDLVRANRIAPFHASFAAGHNSTDYRRFYAAKPGEIYKVTQYQSAYEPYVIVRKDAAGWYVFFSGLVKV
jgi:Glycosyl-transferase for dystroglycan